MGWFILFLVLFVFFAIFGLRHFRWTAKNFLAILISGVLVVSIIYILTFIYKNAHPSVFIILFFLLVAVGLFLVKRYV